MPTARELLDQADALMRRNRGREPEPDIPELTDEVVVAEAPPSSRRSTVPEAPAALRDDSDDVPELTEAVARIEEIAVEPPSADAVDSRWLESELGGASITGPAPDSIAVVPPATLRPVEPAAEDAPPPPALERPDEPKPAPETAAAMLVSTLDARAEAPAPEGDAAFDAMLGVPTAGGEAEREPSLSRDDTGMAGQAAPIEPAATVEAALVESPVVPTTPEIVEAAASEPLVAAAEPDVAAATPAPLATPAAPPSWEAVAEEIRMQVLQRIDIFTDTGLQGELAARLQPVVDRASADLIATINREVGQLLRAYVAEAIEREIEKWRESQP